MCETFLRPNESLNLTGLTFYGNNRKSTLAAARRGSGGVGFLIKNSILSAFYVNVLDTSHEGIIVIKLTHKESKTTIVVCGCYLPPRNPVRGDLSFDFFEYLSSVLYLYEDEADIVLCCGDFNSRCGDLHECEIPRNILDNTVNSYGKDFIDFLRDGNFVMLNGRGDADADNLTSVSHRGLAVVDYCIVPQAEFHLFKNFTVQPVRSLCNEHNIQQHPDARLPDHSILSCSVTIEGLNLLSECKQEALTIRKYNFAEMPHDFMLNQNCREQVQMCINRLQTAEINQANVDNMYGDFCKLVQYEMNENIPNWDCKTSANSSEFKKCKANKAWWNQGCQEAWNKMCSAEREWLRKKGNRKELHGKFKAAQKVFDNCIRAAKRKFNSEKQAHLDQIRTHDKVKFWKEINKIDGKKGDRVPFEVYTPDNIITSDSEIVLSRWRDDYSTLFTDNNDGDFNDDFLTERLQSIISDKNALQMEPEDDTAFILHGPITFKETSDAVDSVKRGKAAGSDNIFGEVLKNETSLNALHALFSLCFDHEIIPTAWKEGLIHPLPKGNLDPRVPLQTRGITLISVTCKIFCHILNERLNIFSELKNMITEEQNGFRKNRSCDEHLFVLQSVIHNRILQKKSTFVGFIDLKRAFDVVNRDLLWWRLKHAGVGGKFLRILQGLYQDTKCAVRVGGRLTDWFPSSIGFKQGCLLSPILFSILIDDLAKEIKKLNIGVEIGDTLLSILLYADDIAILASTPEELQLMLDTTHMWLKNWRLTLNGKKSKVVHFRPKSVKQVEQNFHCGPTDIDLAKTYTYLGFLFHEHNDLTVGAQALA